MTSPIAGSIIHPAGGDGWVLDVLVGFRLAPGVSNGGIDGLRVRYNSAGNKYETVLPWSLKITPSPNAAQSARPVPNWRSPASPRPGWM